jgi:hypothetical protein
MKISTVKKLSGGYGQVLGFVIFTAGLLAVHGGSILNFGFPLLATALAFFLFVTSRNVYVAFVWWIWLFTPLVRRLVDFQSGYHAVSPVMLTPLLVTLICFIPLLRRPRFILKRSFTPFLLIVIVYVYALVFGAVLNGPAAALLDFVNYVVPFGFALFILDDRQRFRENRDSLMFAVMLGLILIALYGMYQFYKMPPWDAYWLAQSKFASAGAAIAEQLRLFGPLNSPGPYGTVLMTSLILVLVVKGPLRLVAGGVGFPAFGLSLVRSDWGGWALGALFIAMFVGGKTRLRLILLGFGVVIIAYPLVTVGPVSDQLQKRFATFNNIQQDGSYQARQNLYENFTVTAFSQPIGNGFGSNGSSTKLSATVTAGFDSGVLQIPFQFGWVFGALFIWAIFSIAVKALGAALKTSDSITIAGTAIFLVMLLENLAAPMFSEVSGIATWIGVAIALGPSMAATPVKARLRSPVIAGRLAVQGFMREN